MLDPYPTLYTKIKLKYIKDLNLKANIVKFLEENIKEILMALDIGNYFWIWHQKPWQQKKK